MNNKLYLSDSGALERLLAVQPSMTTWDALSPVAPQQHIGGEAGGIGEAEVQAECTRDKGLIPGHGARVVSAVMWRRGPCEDAHHHVKGEQDLGQTNPCVQHFLIFAEATDGSEDLVEIHFGKYLPIWRFQWMSPLKRGRLGINTH